MFDLPFTFEGRIGRSTYWLGGILQFAMVCGATFLIYVGSMAGHTEETALGLLCLAPIFWVGICLNVKRLHDLDKSAWFLLISFMPGVGPFVLLAQCAFLAGTPGNNRFGAPPGEEAKTANAFDTSPAAPEFSPEIDELIARAKAARAASELKPMRPAPRGGLAMARPATAAVFGKRR